MQTDTDILGDDFVDKYIKILQLMIKYLSKNDNPKEETE